MLVSRRCSVPPAMLYRPVYSTGVVAMSWYDAERGLPTVREGPLNVPVSFDGALRRVLKVRPPLEVAAATTRSQGSERRPGRSQKARGAP